MGWLIPSRDWICWCEFEMGPVKGEKEGEELYVEVFALLLWLWWSLLPV